MDPSSLSKTPGGDNCRKFRGARRRLPAVPSPGPDREQGGRELSEQDAIAMVEAAEMAAVKWVKT